MTPEQNAHVKSLRGKKQIFEYVLNHLRQQGAPATNSKNECAYRGEDDTMCAVGCLLADDEYDPSMEQKMAYELDLPNRLAVHKRMLCKLQDLHDDFECWIKPPGREGMNVFSRIGELRLEEIRCDLGIK